MITLLLKNDKVQKGNYYTVKEPSFNSMVEKLRPKNMEERAVKNGEMFLLLSFWPKGDCQVSNALIKLHFFPLIIPLLGNGESPHFLMEKLKFLFIEEKEIENLALTIDIGFSNSRLFTERQKSKINPPPAQC